MRFRFTLLKDARHQNNYDLFWNREEKNGFASWITDKKRYLIKNNSQLFLIKYLFLLQDMVSIKDPIVPRNTSRLSINLPRFVFYLQSNPNLELHSTSLFIINHPTYFPRSIVHANYKESVFGTKQINHQHTTKCNKNLIR